MPVYMPKLTGRLQRKKPIAPMAGEAQQVKQPTLTPATTAPMVGTSQSSVSKPAQAGQTPTQAAQNLQGKLQGGVQMTGQQAPRIGFGAGPNGTTPPVLTKQNPITPATPPPPLTEWGGQSSTTKQDIGGRTITRLGPSQLDVDAKKAWDAEQAGKDALKTAAEDFNKKEQEIQDQQDALTNTDLVTSGTRNVLEGAQTPRDTAADEALIRELMGDLVGQGLVDQRASMGRAGFGASGALAALEGDIRRKAGQQAAQDILGVQQGARDEQLERLRTGSGIDIAQREQAQSEFVDDQFINLLQGAMSDGQVTADEVASTGGTGSGLGGAGADPAAIASVTAQLMPFTPGMSAESRRNLAISILQGGGDPARTILALFGNTVGGSAAGGIPVGG